MQRRSEWNACGAPGRDQRADQADRQCDCAAADHGHVIDHQRECAAGDARGEAVDEVGHAQTGRAALQEVGLIPKGPADQYALVAVRDGWYPVMERGFKHPQYAVFLKEGEVWKYGKTINPTTRYSLDWLRRMRLRYEPQYAGSVNSALALERAKIEGHFDQCGSLPPGNKVRR